MTNLYPPDVQLTEALDGRDGWVRLGDTAASLVVDGRWGLVELGPGGWRWTHRIVVGGALAGSGIEPVAECVAEIERCVRQAVPA